MTWDLGQSFCMASASLLTLLRHPTFGMISRIFGSVLSSEQRVLICKAYSVRNSTSSSAKPPRILIVIVGTIAQRNFLLRREGDIAERNPSVFVRSYCKVELSKHQARKAKLQLLLSQGEKELRIKNGQITQRQITHKTVLWRTPAQISGPQDIEEVDRPSKYYFRIAVPSIPSWQNLICSCLPMSRQLLRGSKRLQKFRDFPSAY